MGRTSGTFRRLQWGRGFAATEGRGCRRHGVEVGIASMGPWLCSHGRFDTDQSRQWPNTLQWGRGFAATEGRVLRGRALLHGVASMGPWLCSHGRIRHWLLRGDDLQRFNGAVALQPRKGGDSEGSRFTHQASMGPWLCSHGRTDDTPYILVCVKLQWGRGFAATEGLTSG